MLTALIFAFTAGAAGAQPKPALVQDRDEPGRNPYQQVAVNTECDGLAICTVDFAVVHAGMRLVLTQATIETSIDQSSGSVYVRVRNNTSSARAAFVVTGPANA